MAAIEYSEKQRIKKPLKLTVKKSMAKESTVLKRNGAGNLSSSTSSKSLTLENRLLERLNTGHTIGDLLTMAVTLINEAVENLLSQVFRKDDYAVKYAVEPLLNHQGPLGQLTVRLKLLYGLGVLQRVDYEDCALLLALRDQLLHSNKNYCFTDDRIIGALTALHCLCPLSTAVLQHDSALQNDPTLNAMRQQRYQQVIRSSTVLSLTELIARISVTRAFE